MKLWLDDLRPAPEGWKWARTIGQAIGIAYFESGIFEECSLDHDLGNGDDLDGIRFVDWMAENNVWPTKRPVVHSMNPVGRKRIEMTIERYGPYNKEHGPRELS